MTPKIAQRILISVTTHRAGDKDTGGVNDHAHYNRIHTSGETADEP
jgi:hypothetical protein